MFASTLTLQDGEVLASIITKSAAALISRAKAEIAKRGGTEVSAFITKFDDHVELTGWFFQGETLQHFGGNVETPEDETILQHKDGLVTFG